MEWTFRPRDKWSYARWEYRIPRGGPSGTVVIRPNSGPAMYPYKGNAVYFPRSMTIEEVKAEVERLALIEML